jgi:O-methyltransferase
LYADNLYHAWYLNEDFYNLHQEIKDNTLIDIFRIWTLIEFAKSVQKLDGDVIEVGVYKGGSGKILAKTMRNKTVHLFDTFEGMPDADPVINRPISSAGGNGHKKGDFADTSFEIVKEYFSDCSNAKIVKGVFPESSRYLDNTKFCFAHIDAIIYESVKSSSEFIYPRMVSAGAIVYDDYGFYSCPGTKIAVDEFYTGKKERPVHLPTGQCVIIKQ